MPARPKVGAKIRRARKLQGWTQQELADKVGVSRNTIESAENDRSYPSRCDVALEEVLGIRLDGQPTAQEELVPEDEWERTVLNDPDLPDEWKRDLIGDSRRARLAYAERRAQRRAREAG
jgi:transcriptional regulator with XRE-family HTH domain